MPVDSVQPGGCERVPTRVAAGLSLVHSHRPVTRQRRKATNYYVAGRSNSSVESEAKENEEKILTNASAGTPTPSLFAGLLCIITA